MATTGVTGDTAKLHTRHKHTQKQRERGHNSAKKGKGLIYEARSDESNDDCVLSQDIVPYFILPHVDDVGRLVGSC